MTDKTFQEMTDSRLSRLTMPDGMKNQIMADIRQEEKGTAPVKKKASLGLILALVLILGTLTAFALTKGFGMFDMMGGSLSPAHGTVRPDTDKLIQTNLSTYEFEHTIVTVTEAAYDGKYLRVTYATRAKDAKTPLAETPTSLWSIKGFEDGTDPRETNPQYADAILAFKEAAKQDGIWWSTLDWCTADGQNCTPVGSTMSYSTENNGEVISYVQFALWEAESLGNPFTVELPLRGRDTPKELAFQVARSPLPGVFHMQPPPAARAKNHTMQISECMASPIRTYITLNITVDAGVPAEECERIQGTWLTKAALTDKEGKTAYEATDMSGGYLDNFEFVMTEENGQPGWKHVIQDATKPVTMQISLEFASPAEYPDYFKLGVSESESVLISAQAIPWND